MEFSQRDVIDLEVYDKDGTFVTKLDFLSDSRFRDDYRELEVNTEVINSQLLGFLYDKEEDKLGSDFENALFKNNEYESYTVSENMFKPCKLIARTLVRNAEGHDMKLVYEIPKASVKTNYNTFSSNTKVSPHKLTFRISPFNERGNLFKIHLEKSTSALNILADQLAFLDRSVKKLLSESSK